jgi:hypothetical protein
MFNINNVSTEKLESLLDGYGVQVNVSTSMVEVYDNVAQIQFEDDGSDMFHYHGSIFDIDVQHYQNIHLIVQNYLRNVDNDYTLEVITRFGENDEMIVENVVVSVDFNDYGTSATVRDSEGNYYSLYKSNVEEKYIVTSPKNSCSTTTAEYRDKFDAIVEAIYGEDAVFLDVVN